MSKYTERYRVKNGSGQVVDEFEQDNLIGNIRAAVDGAVEERLYDKGPKPPKKWLKFMEIETGESKKAITSFYRKGLRP